MIEKLQPYIEYVKTPEGSLIFIGVVVAIVIPICLSRKKHETNNGGRGGNVKASGVKSTAIGGKGGGGGPGGKGGDGGDAEVVGDNSFAMGGEGGESGQINRGGKGGRGPLHVLMEDYPDKFKEISENFGITEEMAKTIGKGGDGAGPSI